MLKTRGSRVGTSVRTNFSVCLFVRLFVCLFGERKIKDFRGICALRVPFSSFSCGLRVLFLTKKFKLSAEKSMKISRKSELSRSSNFQPRPMFDVFTPNPRSLFPYTQQSTPKCHELGHLFHFATRSKTEANPSGRGAQHSFRQIQNSKT